MNQIQPGKLLCRNAAAFINRVTISGYIPLHGEGIVIPASPVEPQLYWESNLCLVVLLRNPSASLWLQAAGCELWEESDCVLTFKVVIWKLPGACCIDDVRGELDAWAGKELGAIVRAFVNCWKHSDHSKILQ